MKPFEIVKSFAFLANVGLKLAEKFFYSLLAQFVAFPFKAPRDLLLKAKTRQGKQKPLIRLRFVS